MRNNCWQLFLFLVQNLMEVKTFKIRVFWMLWSQRLCSFPPHLLTDVLHVDHLVFIVIVLWLFLQQENLLKGSRNWEGLNLRQLTSVWWHTSQKWLRTCSYFQPLLSCVHLDFHTIPGFSFWFHWWSMIDVRKGLSSFSDTVGGFPAGWQATSVLKLL